MNVTAERTVRDVARENPAAPRVFEKFGIDYCCQGDRPLSEACRTANLAIDSVLDALEMAELAAQSLEKQRNWSDKTLTDLIWHIQNTSPQVHARRVSAHRSAAGQSVWGSRKKPSRTARDPANISRAFAGIDYPFNERRDDFVPHVIRMEESIIAKEPVVPAPFGTVENPISMMEAEHETREVRCGRCGRRVEDILLRPIRA